MLEDCKLIELQSLGDSRGMLNVIEYANEIHFPIKRVYFLTKVPSGSERGGHAHKILQQLIICPSGAFDITLDDGESKKKFTLSESHIGLKVTPGIWREMSNFSGDAVCLVIASELYDESDYIRDYEEFKAYLSKAQP